MSTGISSTERLDLESSPLLLARLSEEARHEIAKTLNQLIFEKNPIALAFVEAWINSLKNPPSEIDSLRTEIASLFTNSGVDPYHIEEFIHLTQSTNQPPTQST